MLIPGIVSREPPHSLVPVLKLEAKFLCLSPSLSDLCAAAFPCRFLQSLELVDLTLGYMFGWYLSVHCTRIAYWLGQGSSLGGGTEGIPSCPGHSFHDALGVKCSHQWDLLKMMC